MTTLTAADYADTGQWRLLVNIWPDRMSAHLENTLHNDVPLQELFMTKWDCTRDTLLEQIENAVYDHPRVLDDFSARITIFDSRTAFLPTALAEEEDGVEEEIYTALYQGDAADVMIDTDDDVTAAYCLAPGLKGFLGRTFPGARVGCNLMRSVAEKRKKSEGIMLWVDVREQEADFILLNGRELLSASTRNWIAPRDVTYHILNLLDVYGIKPNEASLNLSGFTPSQLEESATGQFIPTNQQTRV